MQQSCKQVAAMVSGALCTVLVGSLLACVQAQTDVSRGGDKVAIISQL